MIRVHTGQLAIDLRDFFRRAQALAFVRADGLVEVHLPGAIDDAKERSEARRYLDTWRGLHDGASAEIVN